MISAGDSYHRGLKNTVDWRLIIYYLLLVMIGWINIYASIHSADPSSIFDWSVRSGKQFVWILTALGLAALVLFAVTPRIWEVIASPGYAVVLFLLVAVIFLGAEVKGSHSWFQFGPISFQPAEISKITTSLLLAAFLSRQNFKMSNMRDFMTAALIIGVPMLVIVAESETGSALVYVGFIFVMYREGMTGWILAMIGGCILLFILTLVSPLYVVLIVLVLGVAGSFLYYRMSASRSFVEKRRALSIAIASLIAGVALIFSTDFVFNHVLQDHQRKRIEVLLGMTEDPMGIGYNVNQSMIAIGSGGLFGKGYLNGTQTAYGFVPEQSTDFIFCTVGEEWGFLGCFVVIALYVLLIWRILEDAERSREPFTRIYGYCVASCIFMHLFINIGMTIGLMPVIGIPLPLVSYGGSSLWGFTLMLFIFIALNKQEKKYF